MNNVDVTYICMYTMNNNNIWRRVDQLNFRFGDELTSRPRRRDDQGDELTSHRPEGFSLERRNLLQQGYKVNQPPTLAPPMSQIVQPR